MLSKTTSYARLREIKVDPLINEEGVIQNNQPQEQTTDETIGNNSLQENGRSSWLSFMMVEGSKEVKNNQRTEPQIPKVADKLKIIGKEECYDPLVVSIGPHHHQHRRDKLREMEALKFRMTRQFVLGSRKGIEVLYKEVEKLTQDARKFYQESVAEGFNDEQFAQMMFLDGCFILQFINCITSDDKNLEMSDQQVADVKRDLLLLENQLPFPVLQSLMSLRYGKDHGMNLMCDFLIYQILQPKDQPLGVGGLILLRIMLPLALLLLFPTIGLVCYEGYCHKQYLTWSVMISAAILYLILLMFFFPILYGLVWLLRKKRQAYGKPDQQPAHLLELLYFIFVCSQEGKGKPSPGRCCRYLSCLVSPLKKFIPAKTKGKLSPGRCCRYLSGLVTCLKKFIPAKTKAKPAVARGSRGHYLYHSAKDLKKVGIHFMASRTSTFTEVKFKSSFFYGTVELPSITIDVSTKSMLFNLVAYETSAGLDPLWVTSYICFMDSLINDADDVKELRSKGILNNFFGADQQVAELFNHMGSSLKPDTSAYNDVKRDINKQCDSAMKKWVAEWQQTYFSSPWTFIAFVAAGLGLLLTAVQTYYAANQAKDDGLCKQCCGNCSSQP